MQNRVTGASFKTQFAVAIAVFSLMQTSFETAFLSTLDPSDKFTVRFIIITNVFATINYTTILVIYAMDILKLDAKMYWGGVALFWIGYILFVAGASLGASPEVDYSLLTTGSVLFTVGSFS